MLLELAIVSDEWVGAQKVALFYLTQWWYDLNQRSLIHDGFTYLDWKWSQVEQGYIQYVVNMVSYYSGYIGAVD